jgi:hypothetical protein
MKAKNLASLNFGKEKIRANRASREEPFATLGKRPPLRRPPFWGLTREPRTRCLQQKISAITLGDPAARSAQPHRMQCARGPLGRLWKPFLAEFAPNPAGIYEKAASGAAEPATGHLGNCHLAHTRNSDNDTLSLDLQLLAHHGYRSSSVPLNRASTRSA